MLPALFPRLRPHLAPALALVVLTLAVYGRSIGYDFLSNWDDNLYVTGNPDIRSFAAANLMHIFSSSYVGNYAPVHILSYLIDYQVAGLNPAWFHGVNLLFHLANGLLFYLVVSRLTAKPFWAFVAAAVFLVHPVQVESVAWISQRKNLLSMFFSLLSLLCYLSYRSRTGEGVGRLYACSLLFLVLALLSKSVAVVMPCVFLLCDFFLEEKGRGKGLFRDKIPYLVAAALTSAIALVTQSFDKGGGSYDLFAGNLGAKILTMPTVLASYLRILAWPSRLKLIYVFPIKTGFDAQVVFSLLLALALLGAGWYLMRRQRRLFFGFALFFLGLIPVSQIVPLVTLMNDRYLYFPMLGAAWLLGGCLSRLKDRFPGRLPAALAAFCLLAPLVFLSGQRAQVWRNSITLWSDAVGSLNSKETRCSLAEAYLNAGQSQNALAAYDGAFALAGDFAEPLIERKALNEAAILNMNLGSPAKAQPLLSALTARFPEYTPGFLTLGYYDYNSRQLPQAERAYRRALELDPRSPQASFGLANICLETGRVAEARGLYQDSYQNGGDGPDLQYDLACVEALAKDYPKALGHLEEALKLGYRNLDAISSNPELAPLRRLPAFGALMAGYFPGK